MTQLTRRHRRTSPRRIPHALEAAASKQAWTPDSEGHCCGKCWQHTNDPNAGRRRKHCRRCRREWYYANEDTEEDVEDHAGKKKATLLTKIQTHRSSTHTATDYEDMPSRPRHVMDAAHRCSATTSEQSSECNDTDTRDSSDATRRLEFLHTEYHLSCGTTTHRQTPRAA